MRILKTMTAVALIVMGTTVMAQNQGGRQGRSTAERAKTESETLTTALGLDAAQALKVKEISLKFAVKDSVTMAAARAGGDTFDREAMMTKMQAERAIKATELKAVMTEAQKTKYDEYLKANPQRGFGGGGGQRPAGQ